MVEMFQFDGIVELCFVGCLLSLKLVHTFVFRHCTRCLALQNEILITSSLLQSCTIYLRKCGDNNTKKRVQCFQFQTLIVCKMSSKLCTDLNEADFSGMSMTRN